MPTHAPVHTAHECLVPYISAARDAGFDVHLGAPIFGDKHTRYVYITHPDLPGCVQMQVPQYPSLGQSPQLAVPVKPSRIHGTAVHVDFDGLPDQLSAVLRRVMASDKVLTRFVKEPQIVAVERRIDEDAVLLAGKRSGSGSVNQDTR